VPLTLKAPALQAGKIIRTGGKLYRVEYVNFSRAYCIPLSKVAEADAVDEMPEDPESEGSAKAKQGVKGAINIGPNSIVDSWDSVEEAVAATINDSSIKRPPFPGAKESNVGAVSAIPVGSKSARDADKARMRARNDKAAGIGTKKGTGALALANRKLTGAAAKAKANAKPKAPKELRKCLCGCGEETASYFCMGHDARFKSWMVKIERGDMAVEDLPAVVRKAYEWKKVGKGFRTTRDYRGGANSGYDKKA
jgi:hypothetical protein